MFIVSNEKIWLMGKDGEQEKLRKDFSGVSLFRFELAERKSTNSLTGCFRFISASGKNVAAEAIVSGIYDVRLENDVLKLSEDQVLYRDQPIQEGHFKPVAFPVSYTHLSDMERARQLGIEAYNAEQVEKTKILDILLSDFNDGRKKTLFCTAVSLLDLRELQAVLRQIENRADLDTLTLKEKSAFAAGLLQEAAAKNNIELKLRKKK